MKKAMDMMKRTKKFDLDKILIFMSISFIVVPIIIFLWGWTKLFIAILGTIILSILVVGIYGSVKKEFLISIKVNRKFWIISILVISIWCLFSGIGGFSFQTYDFIARNPFFHDLCYSNWPVSFDISRQPELIQNIFENVKVCNLVYYYTWWLPVAGLVKLLNLNYTVANVLLLVYTIIEVFLVYYCLLNIIKRYSYLVLSSLILFGGLDFLIYYIENLSFPKMGHIEWWATYFEYSSNTTQLFYVFNSSLPIWLITCLLILIPRDRYKAAWGALAFAYSPFATLSMIFIVLAAFFKTNSERALVKIKGIVSIQNVLTSLLMLIVWGSYYAQVNIDGSSIDGFIFLVYPEQKLFTVYVVFLLIEVGFYFIVVGSKVCKSGFYWVTLLGLFLIPLFKVGRANDWALKVPIPLLFILMIIVLEGYYLAKDIKKKYAILIVLFLGYMTSMTELQRNISGTLTMSQTDYTYNIIETFGYINTGDEATDRLFSLQYLAPETNNFWNKYITK